ncbi:MAG: hypothetical protein ACW99U_02945 [Candidatus Thorarchaeota archaeon]|jgi:hypothetical protein
MTRGRTAAWEYIKSNRSRILVLLFLVYLYRLVEVGSAVWDSAHGPYWPSPGYQLFPIPLKPRGPVIWVVAPLSLVDSFLYIVFVGHGVWIAWTILSLAYILVPAFRWKKEGGIKSSKR